MGIGKDARNNGGHSLILGRSKSDLDFNQSLVTDLSQSGPVFPLLPCSPTPIFQRSNIRFEFVYVTNLKWHGGDLYPGITVWLFEELEVLT